MGLFDRYFRVEEDEPVEQAVLAEANEVLTFAQHSYYARFMAWLDSEIEKPIPLSKEMATIEAAVRSNTFKEVRSYLRNRVRDAEIALRSQREG